MSNSAEIKPHVSASSLDTFLTCGELYYQTRLNGKKSGTSLPALRGTAVHAAAANNYRQKIETREDLSQGDFVDFAVSQFDGGLSSGVHLSSEDERIGVKKVVGQARDAVADLARFHVREQAPGYLPVLVEEKFRLDLPGSHDLLGFVDLLDESGVVTDFKTRSKRATQSEADTSPQLTIYAAGVHALTGAPPKQVAFDVTINMASKVDRQVLSSTRDERDFDALADRIEMVTKSINAGIFPPAPTGSWKCSEKWCPLWNSCKYVNAERVAKQQQD